jgi:hypothetical protein
LRAVVQSIDIDEPANRMKVVLANLNLGRPRPSSPPLMKVTR